jgi:cysteine desulfurase / selenocysteine lyase
VSGELTAARALDPARQRLEFPVLAREIDGQSIVYLDNAATSLTPRSVIAAIARYYEEVGANIHRGKHRLSEEASDHYEAARARVAQFIGAAPPEVVFVRNTTEALNAVCAGLRLTPDDLVVLPLDGHHSNLLPWRRAGHVAYYGLLPSGEPDLAELDRLLERRPRVVGLTHCSNVTGVYAPVAEMAARARAAGALTVLDAAQSAPHRRLRVRELGVDFAAFSAHKMLGPTGIGVLYGRQEALAELDPVLLGGGVVDWVDRDDHRLRRLPHRFEAGTPHIAGAYGLAAAVDYLEQAGMDAVADHERRLSRAIAAELAERPYLRALGDGAHDRGGIVSLTVAGLPRLDGLAHALSDSYGVMCRTGHMCAQPLVDLAGGGQVLRLSGYLYNSEEDITHAFGALDTLVPMLAGAA